MKTVKSLVRMSRRKDGVSPVISTIIIVAVAIAISIAVALYLTGITGTFTKYERLDVTNAYIDTTTPGSYTVNLLVKNSGTSVLSIDMILYNGKPQTGMTVAWNCAAGGCAVPNGLYPLTGSGASGNVIQLNQGDSGTVSWIETAFSTAPKSGQSLELTLHTASGKEYPKVVVWP